MPATFRSYKGCTYLGSIRFEAYHTLAMLPWLVAELRLNKNNSFHQISIELTTEGRLLAVNKENLIVHKHYLSTLSKFSQISHDRTLFTYIQKYAHIGENQPEVNLCHVYQAPNVAMVKELFSSIRELSNHLLREDLPRCVANLDCVASFEVLYVGKLRLGDPQVSRNKIDDGVRVCSTGPMDHRRDSIPEGPKSASLPRNHQISLDATGSRSILSALKQITPSGLLDRSSRPQPQKMETRNRTMILIIGKTQLVLLSADKKQVSWSKSFGEVLSCVEGNNFADHFAITCVDASETSSLPYGRLVFKCSSPAIASEIVLSVKQSKENVAKKSTNKLSTHNFGCDACPMLKFHNLCLRLENMDVEESWRLIENWVHNVIDESDRENVLARVPTKELDAPQQRNEVFMYMLREHFEFKQKMHFHQPQGVKEKAVLGLFKDIKEKAQKTLSASFETLLKPQRQSSLPERTVSTPLDRSGSASALPLFDLKSYAGASSSDESVAGRKISTESLHRSKEYLAVLEEVPEKNSKSPEPVEKRPTPERRSPCRSPHTAASLPTPPPPPPPPPPAPRNYPRFVLPAPSSIPNRKSMIRRISRKTSKTELPSELANRKRTCGELKELWRKAIRETIMLNRMERENEKIKIQQTEIERKQICLDYPETGSPNESSWEALLKNRFESQEDLILVLVRQGVPKCRRGEIWQLFSKIYNRFFYRGPMDLASPIFIAEYSSLLEMLTENQHLILVDLARTFPSHKFYKDGFGEGQLSLFNVLKAYSIVDPEVGYCQGLAFVSGVLLLHGTEEEAFHLLKHLMVQLRFRQLYLPNMEGLQVQLYQLWRLLHDIHNDLYTHFEGFELEPALYATPWFLTVFASQFPLELVVRVFDLIFIQGAEAVIKVALAILCVHKDSLMECDSFEGLSDYLKYTVPVVTEQQIQSIIQTASQSNLSRCILEYEVEFHLIQEEVLHSPQQCPESDGKDFKLKNDLEQQISALRSQNQHLQLEIQNLQEQLQVAHSKGLMLEASVESHRSTVKRLEGFIRGVRDEKDALIHSVNALRRRIGNLEEDAKHSQTKATPFLTIRQASNESDDESSDFSHHDGA